MRIRVEAIVVVAVLLLLLLQLPRVDDPATLRLVGDEITRVEDIRGACLYVDRGTSGIALLYVSELCMHEDPSGTAYVTKLDGKVLENGRQTERLHIDATERAAVLGWRPVVHLDGLVSPGNGEECHAFSFRRLRFRKVIHRGRNVLLAVARVEGRDLVTGRTACEDYDEEVACPAIPLLEPADILGVFEPEGNLGTRHIVTREPSSEAAEGFWALTGTLCWRDGRNALSHRSVAWTAGYRYD